MRPLVVIPRYQVPTHWSMPSTYTCTDSCMYRQTVDRCLSLSQRFSQNEVRRRAAETFWVRRWAAGSTMFQLSCVTLLRSSWSVEKSIPTRECMYRWASKLGVGALCSPPPPVWPACVSVWVPCCTPTVSHCSIPPQLSRICSATSHVGTLHLSVCVVPRARVRAWMTTWRSHW